MAISITRYVDIASAVAGGSAVPTQSLVGRRFTPSPLVPPDALVTVRNAADAAVFFGTGSLEALFAAKYFGYISPSPASVANELQFARVLDADAPATVVGGRPAALAEFTQISDGSLSLVIDGVPVNVTAVDLTSGVTSYADVAAALDNEVAGADVGWNGVAFTITTDSDGAASSIEVLDAATGTDLRELLGIGLVDSQGADEDDDLVDAFIRAEQISDSFGSASFQGEGYEADDYRAVAEYVAAQNVKYQLYAEFSDPSAGDDEIVFDELGGIASVGLIFSHRADKGTLAALPQAVMAATDYTRRNATQNRMFRQGSFTPLVKDNQAADAYDARKINYYGATATAGQTIAFFQRGYLCGPITAPKDMAVHANEQWLKATILSRLMNLFLSVGSVPPNIDGEAMVRCIVQGAIDLSVDNGVILAGKPLTDQQKIAITQGLGDPLAWQDVQANGYALHIDIKRYDGPSGEEEWRIDYILFYATGDSVRRATGSHNLI